MHGLRWAVFWLLPQLLICNPFSPLFALLAAKLLNDWSTRRYLSYPLVTE